MKTQTAIVARGKNKKYIANAINYNGYLVSVLQKGTGKIIRTEYWTNGIDDCGEEDIYEKYEDFYKYYLNSDLIGNVDDFKKSFSDDFKKTLNEVDIRDIIGTKYEKYLIKWGKNGGDLLVESEDEIKNKKQTDENADYYNKIRNKEICINFASSIFGLTTRRVEDSIWSVMKPYAAYHSGNEEDLEWADDMGYWNIRKEDIKGWYYYKNVMTALKNAGYRVSFYEIELTDCKTIDDVYEEHSELKRLEQDRIAKNSKKRDDLKKKFHEIYVKSVVMTEEEVKVADIERNRNMILFPSLDIDGHNIYGSGIYLLMNDNYLYIIRNNGMDGDDWSRNNFNTGGAGAIATRIKITEDIERWLDDAHNFNV